MKVLLVRLLAQNLIGGFAAVECEPLELEYLSAACREAGIQAEIYDGAVDCRRFTDVLRAACPDAVAVTGYLTQEKEIRRCTELVKAVLPSCPVLLGGVHVQLNYRRLMWDTVDVLVRGEDPRAFAQTLRRLDGGRDLTAIDGLCWREGGQWRETPYAPCEIEDFPLPDRSGWAERAVWYHYLDLNHLATVKTAVSCPYSCIFCYGTHLHGGVYQARSVRSVLDELETLEAEHIFFVDSDFLVSEQRMRELLKGLRERNIKKTFICYGRADFIAEHPTLIKELCAAGFRWFLVGIEAVADERLQRWEKGTNSSANDACLRILRENKVHCVALMIADLSFSRADFRTIYRWARSRRLRYVTVQVLTPLPGTELYRQAGGDLEDADLSRWDLAHPVREPDKLTKRQFMRCYRRLLVRLATMGWLRGAYRFVTPRYLLRALVRWYKGRKMLQ
ncbi:MAG: radical SAM protein [Oscillospiraceae bacterium]|nr:radical SAM protein [Oscillospiraceae bacterium]